MLLNNFSMRKARRDVESCGLISRGFGFDLVQLFFFGRRLLSFSLPIIASPVITSTIQSPCWATNMNMHSSAAIKSGARPSIPGTRVAYGDPPPRLVCSDAQGIVTKSDSISMMMEKIKQEVSLMDMR